MASAAKIPAGIVRWGDFTRSEAWAIVSNPWKATKNIPAARVIPGTGPGRSGAPNFRERSGTVNRATPATAMNAMIKESFRIPSQRVRRPGGADLRALAATNARYTRTAIVFPETLYAPPPTGTLIGNHATSRAWSRRKSAKRPIPAADRAAAVRWPAQENQPLRKPLGPGRVPRTHPYPPPAASGRAPASSAYAREFRTTTNAAIPIPRRAATPATRAIVPERTKTPAPTIAVSPRITTSRSPRSRVTLIRTVSEGEGSDIGRQRRGSC